MERGPAGQVKVEQAAPVSTRNSVLPATSMVSQGSSGVMRMDQVGSTGRQAWAPSVSVWALSSNLLTKNWDWSGLPPGCPSGGCSGHSPLQCPPFWQTHIGSGPGIFLGVCPAFSVLQGPLEVVSESEQPRAAFSLLASYLYWPPPSSLDSYRPWRPPLPRLMIGFGAQLKLF